MSTRAIFPLLTLATAAVLVSGCGSSSSGGGSSNGEASKTGPQVAKDAGAALAASGDFHVVGSLVDSSTKQTTQIDLQIQSDGTSGSLTLGGQKAELVQTGGAAFVKAPAGFFTEQKVASTVAAKLAGRWVKLPSDSDLNTAFTLPAISKSFSEASPSTTIENKVETGTLNGQKVVILKQSDGSKLYVAATGRPYPLKLASGSDESGTAILSRFGTKTTIKAPTGAIELTDGSA